MPRPRRRLPALLVAVLATGGLAACGSHEEGGGPGRVVRAETEGLYLDIGELKYQVQASRQLNPADPGDRAFLRGIPPEHQGLKAGETWFGVFLRVQNETDEELEPSGEIEIIDTQEEVFDPIPLDGENVFAYRSTSPVPPGELIPEQDSAAAESPIQGALVLFKLTNQALDNRPLELKIESAKVPQETGIIDLDV